MKSIHYIACCWLICTNAWAQQNFTRSTAILEKVQAAYAADTAYTVNLTYKYYASHEATAASEQQKGELKKSGDRYYHSLDNAISLYDGQYSLMVADEVKGIFLKEGNSTVQGVHHTWLDSLSKIFTRVDISASGSTVKMSFHAPDVALYQYTQIDLTIDTVHNLVSNICLYYRYAPDAYSQYNNAPAPRLELVYDQYNFSPGFTGDEFSISRFIEKKRQRWKIFRRYGI